MDQCFNAAVAAGATAIKSPQKVFWGGYSGYIADPDGHLWEFAFNPYFVFDEQGNLALPD
nr:VOC family protein [Dyella humicola]